MEKIIDGDLAIVTAGPAGYGNNIYIVIDTATNEAAFIDAPAEPEKSIAAAEFAGVSPSAILLTHGHFDHTDGIAALQAKYGCLLYAAAGEQGLKDGQPDRAVAHGDTVMVGNLAFQVIGVPGHTPGSTTYVHGKHAFVGDTLFPGGPGLSATPENLQQEIASITTHLYALPGDTTVWPGHGDNTRIDVSMAEYEVFAAKEHPADLHGDVLWLEA